MLRLAVASFILVFAFTAHAENLATLAPTTSTVATTATADPPARYGILINPLAIGVGAAIGMVNASVEVQLALSDRIGITLAPAFAYYAPQSNVSASGAGVTAALHISLSKRKLSGWYVRPFAGVAYASGSNDNNGATASLGGYTAGAEVGYSWTWAPGFMMNLGAGLQHLGYFATSGFSADVKYPILPRINWSLGYGW